MSLPVTVYGSGSLQLNLQISDDVLLEYPASVLGSFPDVDTADFAIKQGVFNHKNYPVISVLKHYDDSELKTGEDCNGIWVPDSFLYRLYVRQPDGNYAEEKALNNGSLIYGNPKKDRGEEQ